MGGSAGEGSIEVGRVSVRFGEKKVGFSGVWLFILAVMQVGYAVRSPLGKGGSVGWIWFGGAGPSLVWCGLAGPGLGRFDPDGGWGCLPAPFPPTCCGGMRAATVGGPWQPFGAEVHLGGRKCPRRVAFVGRWGGVLRPRRPHA